jgi:integrase
MNKKTLALTQEQYYLIIDTIRSGFTNRDSTEFVPNSRVATALVLEANLGLRISDIIKLRISDIVRDGSRYRLNIKEQKTGKAREFTVPQEIYSYILNYALENKIGKQAKLFDMSERAIQKQLKLTCDYLGIEGIGTHSFRKFYATKLYNENGYNIEIVRELLQHANAAITQRYIGIQRKQVEDALEKNIDLR